MLVVDWYFYLVLLGLIFLSVDLIFLLVGLSFLPVYFLSVSPIFFSVIFISIILIILLSLRYLLVLLSIKLFKEMFFTAHLNPLPRWGVMTFSPLWRPRKEFYFCSRFFCCKILHGIMFFIFCSFVAL